MTQVVNELRILHWSNSHMVLGSVLFTLDAKWSKAKKIITEWKLLIKNWKETLITFWVKCTNVDQSLIVD